MATYRFGNAHGENLTVASGDITNNVITFGNGNGDYVLAEGGNIRRTQSPSGRATMIGSYLPTATSAGT